MHFPGIISLLGLIIASSPLVVEATCFKKGLLLSDLKGGLYNHSVDDALNDFCNKNPSYLGYGHMTYECYSFDSGDSDGAKLEISVTNFITEEVRVIKSDCLATFRREVGGCPHGSVHWLGTNWFLSIDPNQGPCNDVDSIW